jgi:hypothetical protein
MVFGFFLLLNLERMVSFRGRRGFDILGECQIHGPRPLGPGLFEGTAHHFRYRLRGWDQLCPLCERFEHAYQINDLVGFFVDAIKAHLCADRNEWNTVGIGIRRAERQIDRSRSERRDTDSRLTGDATIYIGHEGSGLLVTDKDEANGRSVKCINGEDIFLSGYTKDVFDALAFQTPHK